MMRARQLTRDFYELRVGFLRCELSTATNSATVLQLLAFPLLLLSRVTHSPRPALFLSFIPPNRCFRVT